VSKLEEVDAVLLKFAKEHPDSNLGKAVRSAQSQARDEALEEAAQRIDCVCPSSKPNCHIGHCPRNDVAAIRALRASKP
jgi:hypothetical protein